MLIVTIVILEGPPRDRASSASCAAPRRPLGLGAQGSKLGFGAIKKGG